MAVYKRCEEFGHYIVDNNATIRQTGRVFCISKSSVHCDVSTKLKYENYELFLLVKKVLKKNFDEKHIRGGEATRKKYLKNGFTK